MCRVSVVYTAIHMGLTRMHHVRMFGCFTSRVVGMVSGVEEIACMIVDTVVVVVGVAGVFVAT